MPTGKSHVPVAPSCVHVQLSELQEPSRFCARLQLLLSWLTPAHFTAHLQGQTNLPFQPLTRASLTSLTSTLMLLVSVGHLYQKIHHVLILHSTLWWSGRLWEGEHGAPSPGQHCSRYRLLWDCLPSALSTSESPDLPHWCHISSLTCHPPAWELCHISSRTGVLLP